MLNGCEARREYGAAQCAIILLPARSLEGLAGSVPTLRQRSKLPAFAALRLPCPGRAVAARNIRSGLRDVQFLAGHRSIETTERYIDGDTCVQRRLVGYV